MCTFSLLSLRIRGGLSSHEKSTVKIWRKKLIICFFLRPNFVNAYNYDMNSLDWADQLRTNYQVSVGLRQRKWWWSIFLWAFDVAIVNSYLLYKSYTEMHGFQPKSHYTYREEIFKAWMDPDLYWPTRYLRKSRRDMKLISKSSEESDRKRSRLNSGSISSLSRMTRSSYTTLSFADRPKQSCKTLNQTNLTMVLLVIGWLFQSIVHISLHHHARNILNVNSIDWQTNTKASDDIQWLQCHTLCQLLQAISHSTWY